MNLGQGWATILVLFASILAFYLTTWEEYYTHTLYLGLVSGPVEGITIICLVYAFTGYVGGGHFWQQSLLATIGVKDSAFIPDLIYNLKWTDWYIIQGGSILAFNVISRYALPFNPGKVQTANMCSVARM
jgi:ethanolaminephosphotransferase